ncbi:hypothetical protein C1A40_03575 [Tamlana carrageenivorans]|uniref:Uncharacterized protein n=1 Tax=Pseudotamlana carrageenivorans TaxID=2069432 RepID=A0A2I7SFE2_9FLAO|nr:hypothetical protein C1A40_03575 [Tamlana carrageenivorans]
MNVKMIPMVNISKINRLLWLSDKYISPKNEMKNPKSLSAVFGIFLACRPKEIHLELEIVLLFFLIIKSLII